MSDIYLHTSRGGVAPSASLIEQLQSLLKQKEGELANSQVHMTRTLLMNMYLCMDSLIPRPDPFPAILGYIYIIILLWTLRSGRSWETCHLRQLWLHVCIL